MFQFSLNQQHTWVDCGGLPSDCTVHPFALFVFETAFTTALVLLFPWALLFIPSANSAVGFLFSRFHLVKRRMGSTVSVIKC